MNMREKMARRLAEYDDAGVIDGIWKSAKEEGHHGDCTKQNYTCCACLVEEYEGAADAVLDALMEPTDEMEIVGASLFERTLLLPRCAAREVFRAMIRAAKEGK